MADQEPDSTTASSEPAPAKRSQRVALTVLGVVAALLLGFAVGVLARFPFDDSTDTPAADSVDVGFCQDMSVHHDQAVEMSAIALTRSTDTAVQTLAYDILTTQQNQIGQMRGWLTLWERPLYADDGYMKWMGDDAHGSGHDMSGMSDSMSGKGMSTMPGMASQQDLTNLRQAQGPALDVLFLQLMLRHHQGGKPMAEYAAEHASLSVVRNLAQSMVKTQDKESEQMISLLAARNAQPLPLN
ncbi:DUF305 domain-containing protein [Antrihabitans stalactiti]|uniref:DUF305 domain-containing protein n=1 Tax=Antrihabitans stalactiti TaxID=2584121 RepID=A0A848KPW7_9NOCA|nr:DUF305 domain-containing protein [Antrihabitans stalactiti]NMN98974.1 DUF305 domain-containing protein [Antrihabitans stalactiti]